MAMNITASEMGKRSAAARKAKAGSEKAYRDMLRRQFQRKEAKQGTEVGMPR